MPAKPRIRPRSRALEQQLLEWSLTAATGISSLFMAGVAAFGPKHKDHNGERRLPGDFADLWLCIQLVDSCPSFEQAFPALRQVSPEWNELVERWGELREIGYANEAKGKRGRHHFVAMEEKYRRYRKIRDEIRLKVHGPPKPPAPLTRCQSGSDGECGHPLCPQLVNYKPMCPLYVAPEES